MGIPLPESVATYFDVSNGADDGRILRCFKQSAIVIDEGRTYQGHQAIQSWLRDAHEQFEFRVEPLSASQDSQYVTVTARVSGNFPGSPVQLEHVFQLDGDAIQSLEIH